MVISPTYLATTTRQSANWGEAKRRVVHAYRAWLRAGPEIQQMYSLNVTVSAIRTKMRQEFERHRYVQQLQIVDALVWQSNMEFQETMNYWKQLNHVMKYFRLEEEPKSKVPQNFVSAFLEGRN